MKIKISIGLLLLFCNIVLAQNNCKCKKDSIRYATAYNYIVKDSKNKIWISDSIYDFGNCNFNNDLKDFPEIIEKMKRYWIDKDFIGFDPFYSSCIASIPKIKYSSACDILFFSQLEDSVLFANIFSLYKYSSFKRRFKKLKKNELSYRRVASFTEGREYLFIFNKDNTIKTVFKHRIIIG